MDQLERICNPVVIIVSYPIGLQIRLSGEMDDVLLRKVEELTLYIIQQQKDIVQQQKEIESLKEKLENQ